LAAWLQQSRARFGGIMENRHRRANGIARRQAFGGRREHDCFLAPAYPVTPVGLAVDHIRIADRDTGSRVAGFAIGGIGFDIGRDDFPDGRRPVPAAGGLAAKAPESDTLIDDQKRENTRGNPCPKQVLRGNHHWEPKTATVVEGYRAEPEWRLGWTARWLGLRGIKRGRDGDLVLKARRSRPCCRGPSVHRTA